VISSARIAGLLAAKRVPELIPLCHPVSLSWADLRFERIDGGIRATCEVRGTDVTGFEMEALTGVSVALLTVYDMTKGIAGISGRITDIVLERKSGGSSGAIEC
jgi:cyclic pyranopterin phosphate synthase